MGLRVGLRDWLRTLWFGSAAGQAAAPAPTTEQKFTSADPSVNWTRVETLVHGPGAGNASAGGDSNSAVFACLMAICTSYTEPPLKVMRRQRAGRAQWLQDHPWQALLDQPTPNNELSIEEIWFWTQWAKKVDGNAYWLKVRSGDALTGNVVQFWPTSPAVMRPVTIRGSGDFISYYEMDTGEREPERVPVQNVIHFREGLDDRDHRKGLSSLKRLVRQISTDDEADRFTDALLRNFAVPGLVVTTQDPNLDQEGADLIKERVGSNFRSDSRGKIAVLSNGAKVEQFGFSPEQMDLSMLHRIPEERISAVLHVPPIVAGLGAGLEASTYSNYKQAREAFTEDTLAPMWRSDAATLNRKLRSDFTSDRNIYVGFDLSDVRALQEDEDKKYARLNLGVQGATPWIRVNEARSDVGLPPDDELEAMQMSKQQLAQALTDAAANQSDGQGPAGQNDQGKQFAFLENKANRALLRAFPELLTTLAQMAQPSLEKDVAALLDEQRRVITQRLERGGG
jgi:HK97 family phage portal protein